MTSRAHSALLRKLRASTPGAVLPIALLFLSLVPRPSFAASEWESSSYKGWEVSSFRIEGIEETLSRSLRKGLALGASSGLFGSDHPTFFPQTLNEDVDRTLLFLSQRGLPYAAVVPRFDPDPKKERVAVTFVIEPGPRVRVRHVSMEGVPAALEEDAASALTVKVDSTFTDENLRGSVQALRALLLDASYARVEVESQVAWIDSTRVTVEFRVQPGSAYFFRDILVSGAPDDLVPLVRKAAAIRTGRPYSPQRVESAETNLRVLGLFRQLHIEIQDVAADSLDLVVTVAMRESQSLSVSARYWSDDRIQVGGNWQHRNMFRRGRGGSFILFLSPFYQMTTLSVWWPSVVWPRSRGIASIGVENEQEEAYDALSVGGDAILRFNQSLQTSFRWVLGIKNVDITEKVVLADETVTQKGLLTTLSFNLDLLRTDRPVVPLRGAATLLWFEWAPNDPISEHNYVAGLVSQSAYVPIAGTTNVGFRLTVGLAQPTGNSNTLIANKRFYSGGATTMRGFNRRKLGPLNAAGDPIGGEAKIEASTELRFPIYRKFRSTLFVDAGQVWARTNLIRADNIEVAVGWGLWFTTPVGPLRGDVAYRITDYEKSQPRWVLHFSVGPAF